MSDSLLLTPTPTITPAYIDPEVYTSNFTTTLGAGITSLDVAIVGAGGQGGGSYYVDYQTLFNGASALRGTARQNYFKSISVPLKYNEWYNLEDYVATEASTQGQTLVGELTSVVGTIAVTLSAPNLPKQVFQYAAPGQSKDKNGNIVGGVDTFIILTPDSIYYKYLYPSPYTIAKTIAQPFIGLSGVKFKFNKTNPTGLIGANINANPNAAANGGGGGSGYVAKQTFTYPTIQSGDVVSVSIGSNNTSSVTPATPSNGIDGGTTVLTITRGSTTIVSISAAGGSGGGFAWSQHGGAGGVGQVNGSSGGVKIKTAASGGVNSTPYSLYGTGGAGAVSYTSPTGKIIAPTIGSQGTQGAALISYGYQTIYPTTTPVPTTTTTPVPSATTTPPPTTTTTPAPTTTTPAPGVTVTSTPTQTQTTTRTYTPQPIIIPPISYNKQGVIRWNVGNVANGTYQSFFNTPSLNFTPQVAGTYYVEVTASDASGKLIRIYGQSSPSRLSGIYPAGCAPTESTIIPDITAIPPNYTQNIAIPFKTSVGGFLIEQPLKGWSYTTNSIQTNVYDLDIGAKPYWAQLYADKSPSTHSKGIYSYGYPNEYVEDYLPHHIPRMTPLKLQYGTVFEYERIGSSFWWTQPLTFQNYGGYSQWSSLTFDTNVSNLSSVFETENFQELITFANNTPSDIILTNNIDGTPVEVLYYALSTFTWSISTVTIGKQASPVPALYYQSQLPYANISNRFYPTIATVPTLDYLYSKSDVGGYFVPQNLGASQYINKDFTVVAPISTSLSAQYIIEDTNVHVGGRGLTKQDQSTIFNWNENNLWMKESSTAGALAGYVKKSLTKNLQTFVPYQSNNNDASVGLVTPQSRVTPWGGSKQNVWSDIANKPESFTGVPNVQAWSDSQILKQTGTVASKWVTDVYGNQYGVFKNLSNVSIADSLTTPGQIWTKTNSGVTNPGYVSLSSVFAIVDSSLYDEIVNDVYDIDCFADVLMIYTPRMLLFTRINYDYNNDIISASLNSTRGLFDIYNDKIKYLDGSQKFESVWFNPSQQEVIVLITQIQNNSFTPQLYRLNLETLNFSLEFPVNDKDHANILAISDNLKTSDTINLKGNIAYNKSLKTYLITYTGMDYGVTPQPFIANFKVFNSEILTFESFELFKNTIDVVNLQTPPTILDVDNTLVLSNTRSNVPFSLNVPIIGYPTSYKILNTPNNGQVSLDLSTNTFSGTISNPGTYQVNFTLSNNAGTSYYCLTLVVT